METPRDTKLLREREAATFLRVSPRTLQGWRYRGGGPAFVRRGIRGVAYLRADLEDWLVKRRYYSTSEYREVAGDE